MKQSINKLATLMKRGRVLHFDNLKRSAHLNLNLKIPTRLPPELELVYGATQVIIAHAFISRRKYLPPAQTDLFIDELAEVIAGGNQERFVRLVQIYSRIFDNEHLFLNSFAKDVSQILLAKQDAGLMELLANTPRSVLKTTHLYCAMTFGDDAIVDRLS